MYTLEQQADKFRNHQLDKYLEADEWSEDDKRKAKEELYDDITWNGKAWDEDLEGYRLDMFTDWENVMCSRLPNWEKIIEMNDIQSKYVQKYCEDAVEGNPDYYCELYCGDDE